MKKSKEGILGALLIMSFLLIIKVNAIEQETMADQMINLETSASETTSKVETNELTTQNETKEGNVVKNGLYKEDGGTRYYINGVMQTGFVKIKSKKYYFSKKRERNFTGSEKLESIVIT